MEYICGSDEVGYGSLAGSLLVVAITAEKTWRVNGLRDSKQMARSRITDVSLKLREEELKGNIVVTKVWKGVEEIDRNGVVITLQSAHAEAHNMVRTSGHFLHSEIRHIVDGRWPASGPLKSFEQVPKADKKFPHVMAASILAKHLCDRAMDRTLQGVPLPFRLSRHMGYATEDHKEELREHGVVIGLHRTSYAPIRELVSKGRIYAKRLREGPEGIYFEDRGKVQRVAGNSARY